LASVGGLRQGLQVDQVIAEENYAAKLQGAWLPADSIRSRIFCKCYLLVNSLST
jgi:hypothetical protein